MLRNNADARPCFKPVEAGFSNTFNNIKSEKAELLFTNRPLDESMSWLPYPKTKEKQIT